MAEIKSADRVAGDLRKKMDVWSVFSPLSGYVPKDSINLGQGFMNWAPPQFARKAIVDNLDDVSSHHYAIPKGRIALRQAIADHYSPSYGRKLDTDTEVVVTAGANEGIYAFLTGWINPGDEVIVFEPYFDQYLANITFNGGVPVCVPLRPPSDVHEKTVRSSDWIVDMDEVRSVITPKTKVILLNTPHNPVGKVFTKAELEAIAAIAKEHNLLVLADEVYDCLAMSPSEHLRIATLPGMWERTITCGSAGKSFSCTGWRIGWLIGPQQLCRPALAATTRIIFAVNSPLQEAVAASFRQQGDFFETQLKEYTERRDVLCKALDTIGLPYTIPDGAYFILVSIAKLQVPDDFETLDLIKDRTKDWRAAWFLAKTAGIVGIPPSDFYSDEHKDIGADFIRLAFCKDVATLQAAGERLLKLKPYVKQA